MVGREVALTSREESGVLTTPAHGESNGAATNEQTGALTVTNLTVLGSRKTREVDGVSFSIQPGEILGIAGVEGNGQTELIEALAGLRPILSGNIRIDGKDVTFNDVRERRDAGLSHIPEDRHRRGLILDYSIADNLVLGLQADYTHNGLLDADRIGDNARAQIKAFDIRPPSAEIPARNLSGGNQQKVVIAREMGREFTVLLASQPTRGVDVGAIEFIHSRLREARAAGKAILLVSAELNEVIALSDRVAVMYRGKFATVVPASEASEESLGEYMIGTRKESVA
jgi:simple sugar transport system ATP-binding protein